MDLKINKELAYRRIAGELFVVDAAQARLHELNGPAGVIWEALAAGKSRQAIISAVVSEYEVEEKTAAADVDEFIKELRAAGLFLSA